MPVVSKSQYTILRQAKVVSSYQSNRLIDVEWIGVEGFRKDIVVTDAFGSYSFPRYGDRVLVVGDGYQFYAIGKLEKDYSGKIDGKIKDAQTKKTVLAKLIRDGEVHISNLVTGVWAEMTNSGNFAFLNGFKEGLKYLSSLRLLTLSGKLVRTLGNGIEVNAGSVIRNLPVVGEVVIPDETGSAATEYKLSVKDSTNLLDVARLHLGYVTDNLGLPEVGSFGSRLKAILEYTVGKIPTASLKIDEAGNIEVNSNTTSTILGKVLTKLGSVYAIEPVVRGTMLSTATTAYTSSENALLASESAMVASLLAFSAALQVANGIVNSAPASPPNNYAALVEICAVGASLIATCTPLLVAIESRIAAVSAYNTAVLNSLSNNVMTV